MDNLPKLDSDLPQAPDYECFEDDVDQPIEAPEMIGQDERRMHVRAYNFWAGMLGDLKYPDIEDLEPQENGDFGPNSVLLDFTGGIEDPAIAFLGERLRSECDIPDEIQSISEVPARSLLSRITDHYLQIIANEAPIGFEAEFINHLGTNIMYRGILLPYSTDNQTIDFIYGVINWKECAPKVESEALELEIDSALQAAIPRTPLDSPVWADGPTSTPILGPSGSASEMAEPVLLGPQPAAFDDAQDNVILMPEMAEQPGDDAALADWLHAARSSAEHALDCEKRSRAALYGAIGKAYDFYLMTKVHAEDYQMILEDCGITVQERAPMTPIVKLIFGQGYDKTRLTEFAAALRYAEARNIERGTFASFLEQHQGGLKAVVQAERAERNGTEPSEILDLAEDPRARLRAAPARSLTDIDTGEDEFVLVVARRGEHGVLELVGHVAGQPKLTDKALQNVQLD